VPRTTARITCGFANAIDGSFMSIALSLRLLTVRYLARAIDR
jgi:hypothetical protein